MTYQSFESLDVWQRARSLARDTYRTLEGCKDFGLKDQMTRAAVSIPSNIAEGYERGSNKEFVRFLNIAKGSAAELRTQLYISHSIDLIDADAKNRLVEETRGIGAMLRALARSRTDTVDDERAAYDVQLFQFPETGNRKPETGL